MYYSYVCRIKTMSFENAGGGAGENRLTRIPVKTPSVATISGPPPLSGRAHDQFFRKKVSGCVAIGVRSVCVKFRGHAVWLGCKNIGLPSRPKRLFLVVATCGNYQKRNIL